MKTNLTNISTEKQVNLSSLKPGEVFVFSSPGESLKNSFRFYCKGIVVEQLSDHTTKIVQFENNYFWVRVSPNQVVYRLEVDYTTSILNLAYKPTE